MQIGLSGSPLNSLKPFCFTLDGFIGRVRGFVLFLVDSGDFLRGSFHVEHVNSSVQALFRTGEKPGSRKRLSFEPMRSSETVLQFVQQSGLPDVNCRGSTLDF